MNRDPLNHKISLPLLPRIPKSTQETHFFATKIGFKNKTERRSAESMKEILTQGYKLNKKNGDIIKKADNVLLGLQKA